MNAPEPSDRSTPSPAPLRVGVIGTGGISRAHAPGWIAAGAELHCHSHDGAEDFARRYGATAHQDLDRLLAAVDAVDICTLTSTHAELAHRALDAGCDVVCEKPLALTDAECAALLEHAERAGRRLLPAHVVRWFPQYHAAREVILAGEIGELAVLRFERTGSFPAQPWFADESRSGGIVMDQMIHDLDQAVWKAGPATSVYARQALAGDGGTVRTAHVVLTHASGAISHSPAGTCTARPPTRRRPARSTPPGRRGSGCSTPPRTTGSAPRSGGSARCSRECRARSTCSPRRSDACCDRGLEPGTTPPTASRSPTTTSGSGTSPRPGCGPPTRSPWTASASTTWTSSTPTTPRRDPPSRRSPRACPPSPACARRDWSAPSASAPRTPTSSPGRCARD